MKVQEKFEQPLINPLVISTNQDADVSEEVQLYSTALEGYKQQLWALKETVSGIAHNLNNLLSAVLGYTDILLLSDLDDKELTSMLKQIQKAGLDAVNLNQRLRNCLKEGAISSNGRLDVNKIVSDAAALVRHRCMQAQQKGIVIHVEIELGKTHPIIGNETQLREVLINLIFNAIDAMPEGGKLRLQTFNENGSAVISVSDSGIGMTEDVKSRVFEPFFTTKAGTGTGLGLSTSYNIIQQHNGEIDLESGPGKGTIFTIRLPKSPEAKSI